MYIGGFRARQLLRSLAPVIKMIMDDDDGQMIFGDLMGLKRPDIRLTDEEKPRKNLTQEICPDRGSNPGPLHDRRACYHPFHSGELGAIWGMGMLSSCICSTLVSVCTMKGITIGPLAQ